MTPAFRPNKGASRIPVVSPVFEAERGIDVTDAPVAMAARLRQAGLIGPAEQITAVSTPPPVQPREEMPRLKTVTLVDGRTVQVITEPPPPLRAEDAGTLVPRADRRPPPANEWDIDTPIHNPAPRQVAQVPAVPQTDSFSWLPLLAGLLVMGAFVYVLWFGNFS